VHHDNFAVAGEVNINFGSVSVLLPREVNRRQRVFGCVEGSAAMSNNFNVCYEFNSYEGR